MSSELDKEIAVKIMKYADGRRFSPTTNRQDCDLLCERIRELGGYLYSKFHMLYDGFDLKPILPGRPIEFLRYEPHEICKCAIQAYEFAKEYNQNNL